MKTSSKSEKRNKTSDKINRIIPHRDPVIAASVWNLEKFLLLYDSAVFKIVLNIIKICIVIKQ